MNNFGISSAGIPHPVSDMLTSKRSILLAFNTMESLICPAVVNFIALLKKMRRIYWNRLSSVYAFGIYEVESLSNISGFELFTWNYLTPLLFSTSKRIFKFLSAAYSSINSIVSSDISTRLTTDDARRSTPLLICDKSSRSCIKNNCNLMIFKPNRAFA